MNISATCKSCKRLVQTEVPRTAVEECKQNGSMPDLMVWVRKLTPMLCCNRCYDFIAKRHWLEERIAATCYTLTRLGPTSDRSNVRFKLESDTKQYASVVAAFYGTTEFVWHAEFVDVLMEEPHRVRKFLASYMGSIRGRVRTEAAA